MEWVVGIILLAFASVVSLLVALLQFETSKPRNMESEAIKEHWRAEQRNITLVK